MFPWIRPSTLTLLAILLSSAILGVISYVSILNNQIQLAQLFGARLDIQNLIVHIVDQETGVRGYVTTNEQLFLQPYHQSRSDFDTLLSRIENNLTDLKLPLARQDIESISDLDQRWIARVAEPLIANPHQRNATTVEISGKGLVDSMRYSAVQADRDIQHAITRTVRRLQYIIILLSVISIAVIAILGSIALRIERGRLEEERSLREQLAKRNVALERSNESLQEFAYVASHDLQEPLRTVASFTQLLQKRYAGKLGADADEFISYAVDGAMRMQQLINDILTYSRVTSHGKPLLETVDVNSVAKKALANLYVAIEEHHAEIVVGELPTIQGDEIQLVQLLQNLVGNALKYNQSEHPRVEIASARESDGQWRISVSDNGIGIAPEYHDRIFRIFQRLHTRGEYSGTGIGLAVCRRIVDRHGGRMWVESKDGEGATFAFTLPASQEEAV
jgi:signal transduction histidine kinase